MKATVNAIVVFEVSYGPMTNSFIRVYNEAVLKFYYGIEVEDDHVQKIITEKICCSHFFYVRLLTY